MVEYINTTLSYDFIPKIVNLLTYSIAAAAICGLLFIALAIIAFILKGFPQKIFTFLASIVLIIPIAGVIVGLISLIMIPTLFCMVSLKIGIITVFGWSEVLAGIVSFIFCIIILALITEFGFNK